MDYVTFGRTGLQVSKLALGTGNFGTGWGYGADAETAVAMLDAYAAAGGNFIDTADVYQFGQSEEILGKALERRREDFVLATKFSSGSAPDANRLMTGNSRTAMIASVEASLRRLKTDRIDLYWVHQPDALTSMEEIVRGLDDLARAGKILYAGLSNFPAWRLARAATLTELTHVVPIAAAQFEHSLVHREAEADLFPACEAFGDCHDDMVAAGRRGADWQVPEGRDWARRRVRRPRLPGGEHTATLSHHRHCAGGGRSDRHQSRSRRHRLGRHGRRGADPRTALARTTREQSGRRDVAPVTRAGRPPRCGKRASRNRTSRDDARSRLTQQLRMRGSRRGVDSARYGL